MVWRTLLIAYITFCMVVMGMDVGAISEHKGLWLGSGMILFVTTLFGFMAAMEFRKHRDAWDNDPWYMSDRRYKSHRRARSMKI